VLAGRLGRQPEGSGDHGGRGPHQQRLAGHEHDRCGALTAAGQQLGAGRLARVEEPERHLLAGQELAEGVGAAGVARSHHPDTFKTGSPLADPVREQVRHRREQPVLRRIPGLEQVVVEPGFVDGGDRGLRVGVSGQQHPPSAGEKRPGLTQELHARHPRHPLVGQQQRRFLAALVEPAQDLQRFGAAPGGQHPVVRAQVAPQVAGHRAQHLRVVVDAQHDRATGTACSAGARPSVRRLPEPRGHGCACHQRAPTRCVRSS